MAEANLENSKTELTECQAKLAQLEQEYTILENRKNKIVANAGLKINKLQIDLAEANSKLGSQQPSFSSQTSLFDGAIPLA